MGFKFAMLFTFQKMGGDQISELRRERTLLLDKVLQEASVGKWSGGLQLFYM